MEGLLQFFSKLSPELQVALFGGVLTFIGTIITAIIQPSVARNELHIITHRITHPLEPLERSSNQISIISAIRYFCYAFTIIFIIYFLLNFRIVVATPSTPTEQATMVINQFYEYINRKDYRSAYNLTKNGFGTSYEQFVNGYVQTEHNEISIEATRELPDKTIQVVVAIKATENILGKKQVRNYQGTYRVGKEQSSYKILEGQLLDKTTTLKLREGSAVTCPSVASRKSLEEGLHDRRAKYVLENSLKKRRFLEPLAKP